MPIDIFGQFMQIVHLKVYDCGFVTLQFVILLFCNLEIYEFAKLQSCYFAI
jgi:hypothetical protein